MVDETLTPTATQATPSKSPEQMFSTTPLSGIPAWVGLRLWLRSRRARTKGPRNCSCKLCIRPTTPRLSYPIYRFSCKQTHPFRDLEHGHAMALSLIISLFDTLCAPLLFEMWATRLFPSSPLSLWALIAKWKALDEVTNMTTYT